jgi:hypothetical protein
MFILCILKIKSAKEMLRLNETPISIHVYQIMSWSRNFKLVHKNYIILIFKQFKKSTGTQFTSCFSNSIIFTTNLHLITITVRQIHYYWQSNLQTDLQSNTHPKFVVVQVRRCWYLEENCNIQLSMKCCLQYLCWEQGSEWKWQGIVKKFIKLLNVLDIFIFVPIGIKQHVGLGKWENNSEVSLHKFEGKVSFGKYLLWLCS